MEISSFDDLLRMAVQQEELQRLLLVFCKAELPGDATPVLWCPWPAWTNFQRHWPPLLI